uniref:Two pore segment channel 3 n=1 Tax=Cyprinodon variegatus TaxID=28743 RepID=A0A3Q2E933_CYPVA
VRGWCCCVDFDLATIYVSDAQNNRNIYFDTSPQAVRLYLLYNHWILKVLLFFFILVTLSLAIFEEPAVFSLPTWVTMLVELLCLLVFTVRLVHYAKVIPRDKFWKDPKNICIIAVLLVGALAPVGPCLEPPMSVFVVLVCRGLTTIEGTPYFTNYLDIVFELYVLVTTANNGGYFSCIYFNEEIRQLVRAKRHKMARAFGVLQEQREGSGPPVVSHENWTKLVRQVRPDISDPHRELLWRVCDDDNQGFIGKVAFVQLADLLNIEVITLKSRPHPLQSLFPNLYESAPSRLLCRVVQHRGFVITFDLIIMVNAVFIGLDEENPLISNSEWAFLALYVLEILLKLYVFEPRAFFSKHTGGYTSRQVLDIVFILRVLRLIRVVDSIKRFRTIINTLIRIGPAILTFGQLILVVYYVFAMVGMELFKNKVRFFPDSSHPEAAYCGNPLLNGSTFAQLNYCKNNFNNVLSSFVLLLELTVVNQCNGFATVTHKSALIFFVLFHVMVVIFFYFSIRLSCVKPWMVLCFFFFFTGYRTVDALLQRMFEADLDPEDFAENDIPEEPTGNFANPTFGAA